jgi:pantetheine-phosphate adenylyltransferase
VIAYCPGSYDPITNGHVDIIERAARLFAEVVVAVADEANKEFLFSLPERVAMCTETLAHVPGVRIEPFTGLLVEAARAAGATVIVKGLRQSFDLSHEGPMAYMNRSLQPDIETLFMLANPANTYVSSSLIKWVCSMGGDISAHVPAPVAERLRQRLSPT